MGTCLKRIPIADLNIEDDFFRSSYGRSIDCLKESIEAVGLIRPVTVYPRNGRFSVVSGFLRIQACVELGLKEIPAEIREDVKPEAGFLIQTLHENRFTRGFNWLESAIVLSRLSSIEGIDKPWMLKKAMPAMALPPGPPVLDEYLRVAGRIELQTALGLIRGGCSFSNALRLSKWDGADQRAFLPLLERLHFGENVLRECIELVREVSMKEDLSPAEFLNTSRCRAILDDPEADRPTRTKTFRSFLRAERYPTLDAMESRFNDARRSLGLPTAISLQPAPFFEESGVTVSFRAKTPEQFRELASKIEEAANNESAGRLFTIEE